MKRLSRRQRRELAALGQQLADQDPELAEQLSQPPVPRREAWAKRVGSAMLLVGVVMLGSGILFSLAGVSAIGAVLLMTCWMPPRLVQPDSP